VTYRVYMIVHVQSERVYIGQTTKSVEKRWRERVKRGRQAA